MGWVESRFLKFLVGWVWSWVRNGRSLKINFTFTEFIDTGGYGFGSVVGWVGSKKLDPRTSVPQLQSTVASVRCLRITTVPGPDDHDSTIENKHWNRIVHLLVRNDDKLSWRTLIIKAKTHPERATFSDASRSFESPDTDEPGSWWNLHSLSIISPRWKLKKCQCSPLDCDLHTGNRPTHAHNTRTLWSIFDFLTLLVTCRPILMPLWPYVQNCTCSNYCN